MRPLPGAKKPGLDRVLGRRDLILLFTDGIYEVFDAEEKEFGPEKLGAALQQHAGEPLGALLDGFEAAV